MLIDHFPGGATAGVSHYQRGSPRDIVGTFSIAETDLHNFLPCVFAHAAEIAVNLLLPLISGGPRNGKSAFANMARTDFSFLFLSFSRHSKVHAE